MAQGGRPKGSIKPKESLLVIATANKDAVTKPTIISPKKTEVEESLIKKPHKCVTCGTRYAKQEGNFSFSQSPFFKGNNSYLPICNDCIDSLVKQYQEILGDQDAAIKRVCLHWDIYQNDSILSASKKSGAQRSRIKEYVRQCNLNQNSGKTYDDYLYEQNNNLILSESDIENMEEPDAKKLQKNMKRWGIGYSEAEYDMLNEHYKLYKDSIDEENATQATLLNDLCEQYVLKARARQDKDMDRYDKVSKLYQQTLGNANLKPKTNGDTAINNPDECWGNFTKIIETMSPAEYFKDKSIFKDYDEQDEYYRRFVERPTNNLINGTSAMDEEYSIKVTEDE